MTDPWIFGRNLGTGGLFGVAFGVLVIHPLMGLLFPSVGASTFETMMGSAALFSAVFGALDRYWLGPRDFDRKRLKLYAELTAGIVDAEQYRLISNELHWRHYVGSHMPESRSAVPSRAPELAQRRRSALNAPQQPREQDVRRE